MEMEIQSLLEKLLDINDSMSRCAASAAPTTSVTQKLARHRDILHEFTQVRHHNGLQVLAYSVPTCIFVSVSFITVSLDIFWLCYYQCSSTHETFVVLGKSKTVT